MKTSTPAERRLPEPAFLLYLTLYTSQRVEYPVGRASLPAPTEAHSRSVTSVGIADTLLLCSGVIQHSQDEVTWSAQGVSYTSQPYSVTLDVDRLPVYAWGIHNEHSDLLVLTNLVDLDSIVQASCRNEWWLTRLKPVQSATIKFSPSRLASKWARWRGIPQSTRFTALQSSLFHPNAYESRP